MVCRFRCSHPPWCCFLTTSPDIRLPITPSLLEMTIWKWNPDEITRVACTAPWRALISWSLSSSFVLSAFKLLDAYWATAFGGPVKLVLTAQPPLPFWVMARTSLPAVQKKVVESRMRSGIQSNTKGYLNMFNIQQTWILEVWNLQSRSRCTFKWTNEHIVCTMYAWFQH